MPVADCATAAYRDKYLSSASNPETQIPSEWPGIVRRPRTGFRISGPHVFTDLVPSCARFKRKSELEKLSLAQDVVLRRLSNRIANASRAASS